MTQPVLAVQPAAPAAAVTGQPIIAASPGEPSLEQIAASLPEPSATTSDESAAEAKALLSSSETTESIEAKTEEPTKPTPEQTADVDRLERATKAAAKAREGSRRYAETQRQLQAQAYRTQQAAREAEALRQENIAARQREEALLRDPYKALKDRGMTDSDLAQRALRENTPEAVTARLEEALIQERQARVALEQRLERQAQQVRVAQAESAFVSTAKDAEAYPELAVRKPAVQLVAAREALAVIAANGHDTRYLTNEQIAEAANIWLSSDKPKEAKPAPPAVKPVTKSSGQTLTNKQAQTRVVAPAQWDSLTEEQQLAHIAASLPDPT